jgi:hypothetical protein
MAGKKLIRQEEVGIVEGQRQGSGLMTAGKWLLWMDIIPLAFVFGGLAVGSKMWLWWLIIEGVIGIVLLAIGSRKRGSLTHIPR